jgi:hypothetical protein
MTKLVQHKSLKVFLLFIFLISTTSAQVNADKSRNERWLEDIRLYASQLPKLHKNLFFHLPKADFEKDIKRIEESIQKSSDDEIIVALKTLTAKIGDGHTTIGQTEPAFSIFPISIFR